MKNVTRNPDETQEDAFTQSDCDDFLDSDVEAENFQKNFQEEIEYDEFHNFKSKVEKFKNFTWLTKKIMKIFSMMCYAVRFSLTNKKNCCEENEMKSELPEQFYEKIKELKQDLILDFKFNTFEMQCLDVNEILMSKNVFSRVFT